MEELVSEFLINGVGLALLVSVVMCGALRFGLGGENGARLAGAAIALAFLAAYANLLGWPALPPRSATQKVAYLVLIGLVVGLALDLTGKQHLKRLAPVLFPAAIAGWIGWRQITSFDPEGLLTLAVLWLAGIFVLRRLQAAAGSRYPAGAGLLLAASTGAALVAFIGAAASQAQLMGVLAAAAGGFLLWNWPTPRLTFNDAAVFGSGTALMAVCATLVLYSDASRISMLLILAVFLTPAALADKTMMNRPALASLALGALSLIPVAIAAAVAVLLLEGN